MNQEAIIADIENRARAAGASMATICKRAGVHPTTFSRWKRSPRNPEPIGANLASIEKIYAVLKELAASQRAQPRRAARSRVAA